MAAVASSSSNEPLNVDSIIAQLLEVRGSRPGKQVNLRESDIRGLCTSAREIFMNQPVLLELEAPIKICGAYRAAYVHAGRPRWRPLALAAALGSASLGGRCDCHDSARLCAASGSASRLRRRRACRLHPSTARTRAHRTRGWPSAHRRPAWPVL